MCYEEEHFNDDILLNQVMQLGVRGVVYFLLIVSMLLDSVGEMVTVWFLMLRRACWVNLAIALMSLFEFGLVVE